MIVIIVGICSGVLPPGNFLWLVLLLYGMDAIGTFLINRVVCCSFSLTSVEAGRQLKFGVLFMLFGFVFI